MLAREMSFLYEVYSLYGNKEFKVLVKSILAQMLDPSKNYDKTRKNNMGTKEFYKQLIF